MDKLVFIRKTTTAKLPTRGSRRAAGWDVYLDEDKVQIQRGERYLAKTGLIFADHPADMYLRIAPRSGLALKQKIDVAAGVVDEDYRGEIQVLLVNNGPDTVTFQRDDRIAQLIPERILFFDECEEFEGSIDDFNTARGAGGFGSTGA